jgi:apolipoprotein N-acyltransferase
MTQDAPGPPRWRQPTCALVGGLLVALAMPPWGFWPLAFAGIVVFELAIGAEPSRRRRAIAGFAFGAGWLYLSMAWMWFLTVPGYVVACAIYAGYHAIAAAAAPMGRWRALGAPAAHTLAEVVRMVFPFGGVPLATIGISQAGGPLLRVASVGGVIAITWLVFQVSVVVAMWVRAAFGARRSSAGTERTTVDRIGLVALTGAALLVVAGLVAPRGTDTGDHLGIAAVQGGGEQGTRALDVPSSIVTARHLEATRTIEPSSDLDLVVWPENSIDVDREAFPDSEVYEAVAAEAARLDVPFSVGVTIDSEFSAHPVDDSFVNAQVVIAPDGELVSSYEKVQVVPFGEYVPFRGVLEALGAPLEDVPSDATAGQGEAVVHLPDGTRLGVMISWEVFFGERGRAASDSSALLNPTNGASYTWTILQTQQIASSRLRAAETGRWVVQVAPTGFSAFVTPDGAVLDRTEVGEQAVIQRDVPLRSGRTWYTATGDWPWRLAVLGVFVVALVASKRGRRSAGEAPDPDEAVAGVVDA